MDTFTPEECERYARQCILPEFGLESQKKLKRGRVLIVGAGGLGSPVALYLAAAGVGVLGIVDADTVDTSNLQRQIIHGTADAGRPKVDSAKEAISRLNSHVDVRDHKELFTLNNAAGILQDYDVAVGCVDNFDARYILDAECVRQGKLHVYGSINQFEGQASVFAGNGPCYRCFFRDPPAPGWKPQPEQNGVLGSIAGIIGCIQANETIKILTGIGKNLAERLLLFDGLSMKFRELAVKKNPDCPVCGASRQ